MFQFHVNHIPVTAQDGAQNLLSFLRDDLRLFGTKDGCSEGACGTCMVIIDGKAIKACIPKIKSLSGKQITTIEGLSPREREVYVHTFSKAAAVQCGFCIPGMVISAKALLDQEPNPDLAAVKKALRGNICRCTGYVKIEQAILDAAYMFRENIPVPEMDFSGRIGEHIFRLDAAEKILGAGVYADDMYIENMVFAAALRTKYPRAKILEINTDFAKSHPDCVQIFTKEDVPGQNTVGHLVKDQNTFFGVGDITTYLGDALALVVSTKKESLAEILAQIEVRYDILPPITSPKQAMNESAPFVITGTQSNILRQEHLVRGNPTEALTESVHIVERHYSLPFTEHAFLEPECAIAIPSEDGVTLYTGGQSVYDERHQVSDVLGLPEEKVRVISCLVGGGFGGKEDLSLQHHTALAAYLTKLPVKMTFSRQESILVHPKRHAMEISMTVGCDAHGKITAVKADIVSDTGAFASLGGPVLQRACTHAGGPYNFQNIDIRGTAVYTNNPPAGAFRGFGVTQSAFALESSLNLLAEKVGISPWEIRYRNAITPGASLPNGQIADESTALLECLLAVKDAYEKEQFAGIAVGFKNSGLGVGVPDISRCEVAVEKGKIHLRCSSACIGQGMATIILQMACETLALPPEYFVVEVPDTARTPDSGTTTASRQTIFTGEAVRRACLKLKEQLDENNNLSTLENSTFYAEYAPKTDPIGSDKPHPVSHVAYGFAAQVVALDDTGRVKKVTAAYDLGRVVNPPAAEGQIEGGICMGLGYALTEDFPLIDGMPQRRFGTLGLWRATEMPPIEVHMVQNPGFTEAAYGAKGVGELATIPTAPAVHGAYYAYDGMFRQKLPLTQTAYTKK